MLERRSLEVVEKFLSVGTPRPRVGASVSAGSFPVAVERMNMLEDKTGLGSELASFPEGLGPKGGESSDDHRREMM